MIFVHLPIDECEGAILAHSHAITEQKIKKGTVLSAAEITLFRKAGVKNVTIARLEKGDITEDKAASILSTTLLSSNLYTCPAFTGRANLYAKESGLIKIDVETIDAINAVDEAITIATLPPWRRVARDEMVATIKIIPFAVPEKILQRACEIAKKALSPILSLSPFQPRPIALIQTVAPFLSSKIIDKTTDTMRRRLHALSCSLSQELHVAHDIPALATALQKTLKEGARMILILGASAIMDRRDVIPSSILQAGGKLIHFGMPVDPGNLLLLAEIGDVPVLGLPGCARSLRRNGVDWILERLLANIKITANDIQKMGVGGLLEESYTRPHPREIEQPDPERRKKIAGIVLAAGKSSRMGENKLLLEDFGIPILLRTIDNAIAANLSEIIVVLGERSMVLAKEIASRPVRILPLSNPEEGLSQSLRAGISALAPDTEAALILLGDMPRIGPDILRQLMEAYQPEKGKSIIVPIHNGKRGNPVLWDRRYFTAMQNLAGDVGAKHLIGEYAEDVVEIEIEDSSIFLDIDTEEAYRHLKDVTPP